MLKIYTLERKIYSTSCILGVLYNSYNAEICRTLENPWRNNLPTISSIPEGPYVCTKFNGNKYKNVWEVNNVVERSAILIHNGNVEEHTKGCILVGKKWGFLKDEPAVLSSRTTLDTLRQVLPDEFKLNIIRADY